MNTISIWNKQTIFKWDENLPPNCPYTLGQVQSKPEVVLPFWKHVGKYMRYSTRKGFFFLPFSVQNLKRILAEFGQIHVDKGYRHIADLKAALADFKTMEKRAVRIKAGELEDIQYKVPPLAPYQHIGANLLVNCRSFPLFASCGLGKSWMVLVSTEEQFRRGLVAPGKVLICGKLQTLETGWLEDCRKFTHMTAVMVWCKQCKNRKQKLIELLNTPADIYVINHDGLRILEEELVAKRFEKVVVDESTILKGYMGDRFQGGAFGKALMNVSTHAKYRVIMSGTPAPNGPQDLWGQFHFLDPNGFLLEATIHDFRNTWMREVHFGNANDPNTPSTWVPAPGAEEAVGNIIAPLAYRVRIRDVLPDLPPETYVDRYCEMVPEQLRHYKEMEEALFTEIDGKNISADLALAKLAKLRQITGGFIIDHQEEAHAIPDTPKLELLDGLLNDEIDSQDKVVIFAQYRWEIETIISRYKSLGVTSVYGGNSSAQNMDNIKSFLNDSKIRVIVAHPASAGHGISLHTASHYMIHYSISYSAEQDYQACARIIRANQKHPMFIYYLLCRGSIDEIIKKAIHRKHEVQQSIIDQDIVSTFMQNKPIKIERRGRGKK